MDKDISPLEKCGYESLWVALKCKHSSLIEKYYLSNMIDLYKLLRYGNEEHPPLFENKNVKRFYEMYPEYVKKELNNFKYRLEKTDNGMVPPYYFALISIYFNIKIIIVDELGQILRESTSIKKIQNSLGLYPKETIKLCYTPNHLEYIPENTEIIIFNKLKEKIKNMKKKYEEVICEKIVREELMLITSIF